MNDTTSVSGEDIQALLPELDLNAMRLGLTKQELAEILQLPDWFHISSDDSAAIDLGSEAIHRIVELNTMARAAAAFGKQGVLKANWLQRPLCLDDGLGASVMDAIIHDFSNVGELTRYFTGYD